MDKYQKEHGKLKDHEDFEKYREWRDEYVYQELKKIEASKDKNYNNIRKMTAEGVEALDDKLSDLTSRAVEFEQSEYVNEDGEKITYDVITFNDLSDINYNIYKKNGQYFIKSDYLMKNKDGYKPITNELDTDRLFSNSEEFMNNTHGDDFTYNKNEANSNKLYIKDFANKHFSEASEILKKRYNIE